MANDVEMDFDLDAVNPYLIDAWKNTARRFPEKVQPNLQPLKDVEKEIGERFPEDYLSFMGKYGALQFSQLDDPQFFFVKYSIGSNIRQEIRSIGTFPPSDLVLKWYISLSRPHEYNPDIGAQIPPKVVPIGAGDASSEYYLMDLSQENYGQIWRLSPENRGTWGSENNAILGHVASSFTSFLASLKTEEEIQEIEAKGG